MDAVARGLGRLTLCLGIALLSYAARPSTAAACFGAYQYRVLPMGATKDRLVAVVLDVHRGQRTSRGPVLWFGELSLVEMSFFGQVERTVTREPVEFRSSGALRPALARAHARAWTIDGFTRFQAPDVAFCDYKAGCQHARWTRSGRGQLALDVRVAGARGRGLPVVIPLSARDKLYDEGMLASAMYPRRLFTDVFARSPFPLSSVRVYRAGGRAVFVAHAGTGEFTVGDQDGVSGRMRALPAGACEYVSSCIYSEPTPHHGSGFDVVMTRGVTPPSVPPVRSIPEDPWTEADIADQERRDEERRERERARAQERAAKLRRARAEGTLKLGPLETR